MKGIELADIEINKSDIDEVNDVIQKQMKKHMRWILNLQRKRNIKQYRNMSL